MSGPRVSQLSIAPVKGLALQHPERVRLERKGVVGDRCFFLLDSAGKLFSVKNHGPLVRAAADYEPDSERLRLTMPGGNVVSANLEFGERLVTDLFGRVVSGQVVTGPWSDALSEHAGRELRLVRADDPGKVVGSRQVTMLSRASADAVASHAGTGPIDLRRFRMLVDLDGCRSFEEDDWVGHDVSIGEAVVRVEARVPRCVVPTRNPDSGERDLNVLHLIKDLRGVRAGRFIDLGVHGAVKTPGFVRVGDPVVPL